MVTRDEEIRSLNSELAATKANHESTTRLLAKAQGITDQNPYGAFLKL